MSKMILGDNSEQFENTSNQQNNNTGNLENVKESTKSDIVEINMNEQIMDRINEIKSTLNLFQGRTDPDKGDAKFPDWDIVPPNQFINPRIKSQ